MSTQKIAAMIFVGLACVIGSSINLQAQATATPFASGLIAPTKSVLTARGNLLVAEQGSGINNGRLSLIDRKTGTRRTILDGLPAATNFNGGEASPSGPSGLTLSGDTLYLTIGLGDATGPGPVPGSEMENPTPASPILSSVLSIRLSAGVETGTESFTLTLANHTLLKSGGQVVLTDTHGNTLTIELVFVLNSKIPNRDEDYNEMIHAFIVSGEYRARLGLS